MYTQSHLLRNEVLWRNCKVTQLGQTSETLENSQFTFDQIHLKLKVTTTCTCVHASFLKCTWTCTHAHHTCQPPTQTFLVQRLNFPGVFNDFWVFKANRKCFDRQSRINLPFLFTHVQVGSESHKLVFLGLPTFVNGCLMRPVCTKYATVSGTP